MAATKGEPAESMLRKFAAFGFSVAVSLLLLECGTRAFFAYRLHPRILLYGIAGGESVDELANQKGLRVGARWDEVVKTEDAWKVSRSTEWGSYSKYHPHQQMTIPHAGEDLPVGINNFGFRGPDTTLAKPEGVLRVITLGASSTFGYHDRDDETYPHYLQEILDERLSSRVEVLNFGIPHLDSGNIYAFFMAEGLDFEPDVVTFYEGVNDTRQLERSASEVALLEAAEYSLFLRFLQHTARSRLESFSADDVDAHARGKPEGFVENVARIAQACEERGIRFVAISQQAKSRMLSQEELAEVSYAREVEMIREQLAEHGRTKLQGMMLLIHSEINDALRDWVAANEVPFVDINRRMDEENLRDTLATWVHLLPEGNRFIAAELSDEVIAQLRLAHPALQ